MPGQFVFWKVELAQLPRFEFKILHRPKTNSLTQKTDHLDVWISFFWVYMLVFGGVVLNMLVDD